MDEWILIAVRFGLYIDLMLLFGLSLFGLYALRGEKRANSTVIRLRSFLSGAVIIGILLSVCAMLVLAKSMSGVSRWVELEQPIFEMIMTGTDIGLTWTVRTAALMLVLLSIRLLQRWPSICLGLVVLLGGTALATLAWTGHGAMDEGVRRYIHLTSGILHLLAAGSWFGALVAFALLLWPGKHGSFQHILLLSRTLTAFAVMGTVIVITLVMTGIINYWLIIGATLHGLLSSLYGQLLLIKLVLFVLMVILAAVNRFCLTPLLEQAIKNNQHQLAIRALRRSLTIEVSAAILILGLVAWLGTLSPEMAVGQSLTSHSSKVLLLHQTGMSI